ncbi:hypothetical protein GCM10009613_05050 [Pseudonocardia kongjuensis]|uniref:Uncharacterized protein n=1 Tax=Pseudonocardia kongjuensis TaxID=102227 RepID=A0ABP4I9T3_9PSEU
MTGSDTHDGPGGDSVVHVTGGTFTGGTAIGIGTTSQVTHHAGAEPAGTDLRATLQAVRDRIVDGGQDDDERAALRADVQAILAELDRDEPRSAVVRSRWEAVRAVLGQALAHSADLLKITEIIANRFPG